MMSQLTSSSVIICLSLLLTLFSWEKAFDSSGDGQYLDQGNACIEFLIQEDVRNASVEDSQAE